MITYISKRQSDFPILQRFNFHICEVQENKTRAKNFQIYIIMGKSV